MAAPLTRQDLQIATKNRLEIVTLLLGHVIKASSPDVYDALALIKEEERLLDLYNQYADEETII